MQLLLLMTSLVPPVVRHAAAGDNRFALLRTHTTMGLLRLGCVAAALSITAVVAPKPVLSPTQYAANGACKAAKPEYWKGGTGTPEPAEREALYEELSALFDTVDWSDPAKDAPGLDNDTKLDKDSFAKYIGDAAKLSDSVCVSYIPPSAPLAATTCRRRHVRVRPD